MTRLLTTAQVAGLLNCSSRTVHAMAQSGQMPAPVIISGLVRYREQDIADWIDQRCPDGTDLVVALVADAMPLAVEAVQCR